MAYGASSSVASVSTVSVVKAEMASTHSQASSSLEAVKKYSVCFMAWMAVGLVESEANDGLM